MEGSERKRQEGRDKKKRREVYMTEREIECERGKRERGGGEGGRRGEGKEREGEGREGREGRTKKRERVGKEEYGKK